MSRSSLRSWHSSDENSIGLEIDEACSESSKNCFTCGKDGAFCSCLECVNSSCEMCVGTHARTCTGLDAHDRIPPAETESLTFTETDRGVTEFDRQTEYCHQHKDRQKDMFCKQHDVFVCSTCVDLQHRTCKDVSSVSRLAQKVTKSNEYKTLRSGLTHVREKLSRLKKYRKDHQKKLKQETDESLAAISEFRKDINWVLDRLEKKGRGFIEKRYKELNKSIEEDIKTCDDMMKDLDKLMKKMESKEDKSELFYSVKKGNNTLIMAQNICKEIKSDTDQNDIVKFAVDPKVKEFAMSLGWYGKDRTYLSFEPPVSLPHMYKVKHDSNFDMKVKGDKSICSINSACQLQDGTFIVTDLANKKVKHVDITYKPIDCLVVPGEPLACCQRSESSAVVSVSDGSRHGIHYVGIENCRLTYTGEFSVSRPCIGVATTNDNLFLAFTDSITEYTFQGDCIREVYKTENPVIQAFIANDVGSKLFVTDKNERILQIDTDGTVVQEMKSDDLKDLRCMALDRTDQLFVAGYESHNVCMFSHEGESMGAVLSARSHKFKQPQMLCFDKFNSRLILGVRGSNIIKVYDLK